MDFYSKKGIREILRKHNIGPSKKLGQNFLIEKSIFKKIISTARVSKKDIVLEIGAGIGNLTQLLAEKSKKVVAVEKDKKMTKILKETLSCYKNVQLVQKDILKIKIKNLIKRDEYKIVSNLPYYITSPVIRKFLETEKKPSLMVLMVQKEVAERICANPPKMNLLAVSVQFYSNPEIIDIVPKERFWPKPKVDSAILKIILSDTKPRVNPDLFFKTVKTGFSHPRKQLVNNLLALKPLKDVKLNKEKIIDWLKKNKIDSSRRAETLHIKDWVRLAKNLKNPNKRY